MPNQLAKSMHEIAKQNRLAQRGPTHADRIRGMDDEELAKALYDFEDLCMPDYCQRKKKCDDMLDADIDIPAESCRRCLLDWLRQPAEEVHDGQTI